MSRLGKKPLPIPEKVKVEVKGTIVEVTGPLGKLEQKIMCDDLAVKVEDNAILIVQVNENKEANMMQGLYRGLLKNALDGVVTEYTKIVEVNGLGYKANMQGTKLVMNIGFSHPVEYEVPAGAKLSIEKQNLITVSGIDKALVGQVAASIRSFKTTNPYTGSGLKYKDEQVIRKAGKADG